MSLQKSRISQMVDTLIYTSSIFSITSKDGGCGKYVLNVFDEKAKELIEQVTADGIDHADCEFERLKTKYIFDYENVLFASR